MRAANFISEAGRAGMNGTMATATFPSSEQATETLAPEISRLHRRLDRERKARAEAESITERTTRELYEKQRELVLLEAIAAAANEATGIESAMQTALARICTHIGWPVGHVYLQSKESPDKLVSSSMWYLEHPERFETFRKVSEAADFVAGIGLPGRVLASGEAVWIPDVRVDSNFPRAKVATDIGVRTGFGFPVWVGKEIVAVLEFFSESVAEPNDRLLAIMAQAGTQLGRVIERKQAEERVAALNSQLLETARRAGMADVATSVLHNVGNVLNSVNVSANLVREQVAKSEIAGLSRATALMRAHAHDLGHFLTESPQGKQLPRYFEMLAECWQGEQKSLLTELESLAKYVNHIKDIIAMQQSLTGISGVAEMVSLPEILDDALKMGSSGFEKYGITVVRDYGVVDPLLLDKMKLMTILVNLLRNAKEAVAVTDQMEKRVVLRSERNGDGVLRIEVIDNGVGIAPDHLTRVFSWGFTTKTGGHGFGLHSSALAAKEMGGTLRACSEGVGKGARFVLEVPVKNHTEPISS
jgi:signal transduction histidine kinase